MYILPTALKQIIKVFLKSIKAKLFIMSPKTHSTDVLTLLIALLYSFCRGVILAPLNGP